MSQSVMIARVRDDERTAAELREQVGRDPRNVRLLLRLGDACVRLAQRESAIEAYQAAACVDEELGQSLRACAVYKQILRVDENRGHAHVRLAELYDELDIVAANEQVRLPHVRVTRPANRVLLAVDGVTVLDVVTRHLRAHAMATDVVHSVVAGRSYLLLPSEVSFAAVHVALAKLDAAELEHAFKLS